MSVNVEILTGGKAVPPLSELIPEDLAYGVYDEYYVLKEPSGEGSVIVFDPACICRGICVDLSDDSVFLGLSNVTGPSEIRLFYELVRRACGILGTTVFSRGEEIASQGQIEHFIEEDISSAEAGLSVMAGKVESGENRTVTVFGALNPIELGADDLKKIGTDPEKLGALLHKKQCVKVYYAVPKIFQDPDDNKLVGVFPVFADTLSVLPEEPQPPFYLEFPVARWAAYLYLSDAEYGYVSYEDFKAGCPDLGGYDAAHFLTKISADDIRAMLKAHSI